MSSCSNIPFDNSHTECNANIQGKQIKLFIDKNGYAWTENKEIYGMVVKTKDRRFILTSTR